MFKGVCKAVGWRLSNSIVIQRLVREKKIVETSFGRFFPDNVTRLNFLIKKKWCGVCVCFTFLWKD